MISDFAESASVCLRGSCGIVCVRFEAYNMELTKGKTIGILVVMALTAAMGVLLLFLGCAINFPGDTGYKGVNWWGMFTLSVYLLSPIPLAIARKCGGDDYLSPENSAILHEICYFISACIVVSGFGLPFVLARRQVIQYASFGLISGANIFVFGTIYAFFVFFTRDDEWDWSTF